MTVAMGAKIVAGKIAEQVAIQAAAELLLRRIFGASRAAAAAPATQGNPLDDLELQALMQFVGGGGGIGGMAAATAAAPKTKRRPSKYNLLLKAEMKKLKTSRKSHKEKFKLAAKRASAQLKKLKKEKKGGTKKRGKKSS